ncbi:hypothetical protein G9A89_001978 [Geosiphon pyriformis]|nr:hypothetical protein G9A89_001978 [Geosiphon pyriformis]
MPSTSKLRTNLPSEITLYSENHRSLLLDTSSDDGSQESEESEAFLQECRIVRIYIFNALKKKKQGDSVDYEHIIHQLKAPPNSSDALPPQRLLFWIMGFSQNTSLMNISFRPLVKAIIDMDWITHDENILRKFLGFLRSLICAHSCYAMEALKMTIRKFTRDNTAFVNTEPDFGTAHDKDIFSTNLHRIVKVLINATESWGSSVFPIVEREFPHMQDSRLALVNYIKNLLLMIGYATDLRSKVLQLIIERILLIDTEIQGSIEEAEEAEDEIEAFDLRLYFNNCKPEAGVITNKVPKGISSDIEMSDDKSDMDMNEVSSDFELESEESDLDDNTGGVVKIDARDMMEKLDCCMKLLFDYLYYGDKIPMSKATDTNDAFQDLMRIFSTTILPTFKSRYTQFLLFWHISLNESFLETFIATLFSNLLNEDCPQGEKISSALYIGSLVARAKFIEERTVRSCVKMLVTIGRQEIVLVQHDVYGSDPDKYGVFYSIAQALMYIFCFRWKDLVAKENKEFNQDQNGGFKNIVQDHIGHLKWCSEIEGFEDLITSPLEPLKVCAPDIVKQFVRLSGILRFSYCYSLLSKGKRCIMPNRVAGDEQGEAPMRLDQFTFFPFDPFRLKTSQCYLNGLYREWEEVNLADENE